MVADAEGLRVMTPGDVVTDLNRPQRSAVQTVGIIDALLWVMAAGVVASMVYLSVLEGAANSRWSRRWASTNRALFGGLAAQGLALAVLACGGGALIVLGLSPLMPMGVEMAPAAHLRILAVGILVGCSRRSSGSGARCRSTPRWRSGDDMPALSVRDLTVEYLSGGYRIRPIHRLSVDIDDGELVVLLGASSSGKTTLLTVLASFLTPSEGAVRLDGVDIASLGGRARTKYRRHTVGVVFQTFNLLASLTAVDNVAMPLWAAGVSGRATRRRASDLLVELGMADRLHHRPAQLSGGQQQRVAIARALAPAPLLLADEPTARLDELGGRGARGAAPHGRSRSDRRGGHPRPSAASPSPTG